MVLNSMIGGGMKSATKKLAADPQNTHYLLIAVLGVILIKTLAVQWSYNIIFPRLISNFGASIKNFRPLTFYESFILVILVSFLF